MHSIKIITITFLRGVFIKKVLKVIDIEIGSWMTDLQGSLNVNIAAETIRIAYENGVNFFDCADAYSGGEAEKFLGRVLKEYSIVPHDLIIFVVFYWT